MTAPSLSSFSPTDGTAVTGTSASTHTISVVVTDPQAYTSTVVFSYSTNIDMVQPTQVTVSGVASGGTASTSIPIPLGNTYWQVKATNSNNEAVTSGIFNLWNNGTTGTLKPLTVVTATNYTGATVANLSDSPTAPDTTWATATTAGTATVLTVNFPAPPGNLSTAASSQTFKSYVKKTGTSTTNPNATFKVNESTTLRATATAQAVSSTTGVLISYAWAGSILSAQSGSTVRCEIDGTAASASGKTYNLAIDDVEWDYTLAAAVPQVLVPQNFFTATLEPATIVSSAMYTSPNVTYIQDSPFSPDGNNLIPNGATSQPILELSFSGMPANSLLDSTQTVNVNFTDTSYIGLHIEIWEGGTSVYTSPVAYTGAAANKQFTWDAGVVSDKSGADITIKLVGHIYNSATIGSVNACNWVAGLIPSSPYDYQPNTKPVGTAKTLALPSINYAVDPVILPTSLFPFNGSDWGGVTSTETTWATSNVSASAILHGNSPNLYLNVTYGTAADLSGTTYTVRSTTAVSSGQKSSVSLTGNGAFADSTLVYWQAWADDGTNQSAKTPIYNFSFRVYQSATAPNFSTATQWMQQANSSVNFEIIDASSYQGSIDWFQVSQSGIEYVIFCAHHGSNVDDTSFINYVQQSKKYGIKSGAYFYPTPAVPYQQADADNAASHFITLLQGAYGTGQYGDLMPWLDLEDNSSNVAAGQSMVDMTVSDLLLWGNEFRTYFEANTGRKLGLYVGDDFVHDERANFNVDETTGQPLAGTSGNILQDMYIWAQGYTNYPRYAGNVMPSFGGWTQWKLFQYTQTGATPGISGNNDRSWAVPIEWISPPNVVTGLKGVVNPNGSVSLTWNKTIEQDVHTWNIYLNGGSTPITTVNTNGYATVTGIPSGSNTIEVRPKDDYGDVPIYPANILSVSAYTYTTSTPDGVNTSETVKQVITKQFLDTIQSVEQSLTNRLTHNLSLSSDSIGSSDGYVKAKAITKLDTQPSSESVYKAKAISNTDTQPSSDGYIKTKGITQLDTQPSSDSYHKAMTKAPLDTQPTSDGYFKTRSFSNLDTQPSSDGYIKTKGITQLETQQIGDSSSKSTVNHWVYSFGPDGINSGDSFTKTKAISNTDTQTSSDGYVKTKAIKPTDTQLTSESVVKAMTPAAFTDTQTTSDGYVKTKAISNTDTQTFSDGYTKAGSMKHTDTQTNSDSIKQTITKAPFNDNQLSSDSYHKAKATSNTDTQPSSDSIGNRTMARFVTDTQQSADTIGNRTVAQGYLDTQGTSDGSTVSSTGVRTLQFNDPINSVDSFKQTITKAPFNDNQLSSDSYHKAKATSNTDTQPSSDGYRKTKAISNTDTQTFSDGYTKASVMKPTDTQTSSDGYYKVMTKASLDTQPTSESVTKAKSMSYVETQQVGDTSNLAGSAHTYNQTDTIGSNDGLTQRVAKATTDTQTSSDGYVKSKAIEPLDYQSFSEAYIKRMTQSFLNTQPNSDAIAKAFVRSPFTDTQAFSDGLVQGSTNNYTLQFNDPINTSDSSVKAKSSAPLDTIRTPDSVSVIGPTHAVFSHTDTIGSTDLLSVNGTFVYNISRTDSIGTNDSIAKAFVRASSTDTVGSADSGSQTTAKSFTDTVGFSDSILQRSRFYRMIVDPINLTDTISKSGKQHYAETMKLDDTVVADTGHAHVMSFNDVMTTGDFAEQDSNLGAGWPGYYDFVAMFDNVTVGRGTQLILSDAIGTNDGLSPSVTTHPIVPLKFNISRSIKLGVMIKE